MFAHNIKYSFDKFSDIIQTCDLTDNFRKCIEIINNPLKAFNLQNLDLRLKKETRVKIDSALNKNESWIEWNNIENSMYAEMKILDREYYAKYRKQLDWYDDLN